MVDVWKPGIGRNPAAGGGGGSMFDIFGPSARYIDLRAIGAEGTTVQFAQTQGGDPYVVPANREVILIAYSSYGYPGPDAFVTFLYANVGGQDFYTGGAPGGFPDEGEWGGFNIQGPFREGDSFNAVTPASPGNGPVALRLLALEYEIPTSYLVTGRAINPPLGNTLLVTVPNERSALLAERFFAFFNGSWDAGFGLSNMENGVAAAGYNHTVQAADAIGIDTRIMPYNLVGTVTGNATSLEDGATTLGPGGSLWIEVTNVANPVFYGVILPLMRG